MEYPGLEHTRSVYKMEIEVKQEHNRRGPTVEWSKKQRRKGRQETRTGESKPSRKSRDIKKKLNPPPKQVKNKKGEKKAKKKMKRNNEKESIKINETLHGNIKLSSCSHRSPHFPYPRVYIVSAPVALPSRKKKFDV